METWSVSPQYRDLHTRGLGAMLGEGHTENWKKIYIFIGSGIFSGEIDSVVLLGF